MPLSQQDYQKALRISRAIERYFEIAGKTTLRSTEVYPYLQRQGLVPRDRHKGIFLRRFLKHLKRNHALDLIPQCEAIDQDEVFTNWYFRSAKRKMKGVFRAGKVREKAGKVREKAGKVREKAEKVREMAGKVREKEKTGLTVGEKGHSSRANKEENALAVLEAMLSGKNPVSGALVSEESWLREERVIEALGFLKDKVNERARPERASKGFPPMSLAVCKEIIASWPLKLKNEGQSEMVRRIREKHPRAYEPWTEEEDEMLGCFEAEKPKVLAEVFQRQASAIRSRKKKLA